MIGRILGGMALLILAGCSGEPEHDDVEVIPVSGTVTVDGDVLPAVAVTFVPVGETGGRGGFGGTDASGKFSLKYGDGRDGVPPGEYRVLFSRTVKPDGTPLGPEEMAADAGAENVLPERFNDVERTPIRAVVSQVESEFTFDIKSR